MKYSVPRSKEELKFFNDYDYLLINEDIGGQGSKLKTYWTISMSFVQIATVMGSIASNL